MFVQWTSVREQLGRLVGRLDVSVLDARDAARLVEECATIERLAAGAKAIAAGRVAETKVWADTGERSAAHWLAKQSGTTVGQAVSTLETAERLADCPATAEALRSGELSLAQANEISAAAVINPACERDLVERSAGVSLRELRDEAGRVRANVIDLEARRARIHRQRRLRTHLDADGAWNLHVRDNPERGAEIMAALDPIRDELFAQARSNERREPSEAYAADALVELARRRGSGNGRSSAKVIARIDAPALLTGVVADGEVCEIAGIGPVAVSAVREILDRGGFLAAVITKSEEVLGVAHLGRAPTAKQRTALEWLYPTCGNEGCPNTHHLQIDHREDWSTKKLTLLDWLDRLCPHCHDLKTRHNWALIAGTGPRPLVPPDDPRHPHHDRHARTPARPAAA
jgi:hypothetical protein